MQDPFEANFIFICSHFFYRILKTQASEWACQIGEFFSHKYLNRIIHFRISRERKILLNVFLPIYFFGGKKRIFLTPHPLADLIRLSLLPHMSHHSPIRMEGKNAHAGKHRSHCHDIRTW